MPDRVNPLDGACSPIEPKVPGHLRAQDDTAAGEHSVGLGCLAFRVPNRDALVPSQLVLMPGHLRFHLMIGLKPTLVLLERDPAELRVRAAT